MLVDAGLVVAGLAGLVIGAEFLVRGGSAIATRLGVSPLLVGLTIVSVGTSMPELAVGIDATLNDAGPLAVGNIAGTNIVNILLILGLSAAMVPLALGKQTLRLDLPAMSDQRGADAGAEPQRLARADRRRDPPAPRHRLHGRGDPVGTPGAGHPRGGGDRRGAARERRPAVGCAPSNSSAASRRWWWRQTGWSTGRCRSRPTSG
ncbi:sodium:calcium antiporter [Gordonia paraffinivorans]|uniref:sodium:calcium antiporter n=1 Tax=Gordonia paraffinivorans TaxID=175628 RepID=UPI00242F40C0|nr:hypothetical protein [Gordonia paraffinivorans]